MKITKIETFLLRKQLSTSMRISRGGFQTRQHVIVQVHTDDGITGLGEGIGNAPLIKAILDYSLSPQAVGLDPMDIAGLRRGLMDTDVYFERKGSVLCAFSAIEMACWDIRGKVLNRPVYELLGGRRRDRIEAYASDIYWEEDPKAMAKQAERILGLGFLGIKAHVGCRPPDEDVKRVRILRDIAGKDVKLMIDLNCGYDQTDAVRAAELWKPFGLHWLEEPVHPDRVDAMADLRRAAIVPIAAGENEFRVAGFKHLFDRNAVDVAMPDIGRAGGIQETRDICALAESRRIPVSPHNFSSGILLAATIHLMASTPNTDLLEYDSSDNAVYQELLVEPLEIKNGMVTVPDQPGLGVHLPKEILQKYGKV